MKTFQQQQTFDGFNTEDSSLFQYPGNAWTNNVFKIQKGENITYYLPAYLRIKVKNIMGIDLSTLTGQVNCTIILSILYSDEIEEESLEYLQKSIEIQFNKGDTVKLDTSNLQVTQKRDEKNKLLKFTFRRPITTGLKSDIFLSPFEKVYLMINMTLRNLRVEIGNIRITFKFNLMDCDDMRTKFSISQESTFGIYKIADKQLKVHYSNKLQLKQETQTKIINNKVGDSANKQLESQSLGMQKSDSFIKLSRLSSNIKIKFQQQQEPLNTKTKLQNFRHANFQLCVYKRPGPIVTTVYYPLLLLSVINIAIFYQNNKEVGSILINLSVLLVSFIGLIPVIRKNTAVGPKITLTQYLVFLQCFTSVLTFIHMIKYRHQDDFQVDLSSDGLLLASILIYCIVYACIIVLVVLHQFVWKRDYHLSKKEKNKPQFNFDNKNWYNIACNQYFKENFNSIKNYIIPRQQNKLRKTITN